MVRNKKKKTPTVWEIAKPILEEDYLKGRVTDDMQPMYVHQLRDEYKAVKINNFRQNFKCMKDTIVHLKDRAEDEAELLQYDLGIYTLASKRNDRWHGSVGQRLLKEDIEQFLHLKYKPKELYNTRDEYKMITLKQFRDHIHQETRSKVETNYWIVKRKKKEKKEMCEADCIENEYEEFFNTRTHD